jgi:hypothetical protein
MNADEQMVESDLDEWLDIAVPLAEDEPDEDGQPSITAPPDEELADKLLYKTRRLHEEQATFERIAANRKAEIDAWLEDRTRGTRNEVARIRQSLDLFMWRWHRANPRKGKTLKLPNGHLKLVKRRPKMVYEDPYAAAAFLESHDRKDLLTYTPELAKTAIGQEGAHHKGVQATQTDSKGNPYLAQTFRIAVEAVNPETGEKALTTIPGIIWTEPVPEDEDNFTFLTLEQVEATERARAAKEAERDAERAKEAERGPDPSNR